MNEMVVDTPMGQIVVKPSGCSEYPGVYIDLRRPGCSCDAPLAMVEYTETEVDVEKPAIITRVWDDVGREEYETRVCHRGIKEYFEDTQLQRKSCTQGGDLKCLKFRRSTSR